MIGLAPEPFEGPRIKRAFRLINNAWGIITVFRLAQLMAVFIWVTSHWYWGVIFLLTTLGCNLALARMARCPRCGKSWVTEDLDSMICHKCHLDIAAGLR